MRVNLVSPRTSLMTTQSAQRQRTGLDFLSTALSLENSVADSAKQSVLDGLSVAAKSILSAVKNNSTSVTRDEWMGLMAELKEKGIISENDYKETDFECMLVTCAKIVDGKIVYLDPRHYNDTNEHPLLDTLDQINNWPGNPLDNLELWALSLTKWKGMLMADDRYGVLTDFDSQIDACMRVSKTVKELAALVG